MAHAPHLRAKARQLRIDKRLTIDELAERLALSRSTVYYWVRDLPIEGSGCGGRFPTHGQRLGNRAMCAKFKRLRDAAYAEGRDSFAALCTDPTFRDFVCLYLAEGYKRNRNTVSIANSDPTVLVVSQNWLRRLSPHKSLKYWIQYHADQNLDDLREFWGATLGIDGSVVRFQRKSNSNQLSGRTWRCRYGVLTVVCHDTLLRARLQGWMDCLRESWHLDSSDRGT
jgi:excisionase family DNA binding protein